MLRRRFLWFSGVLGGLGLVVLIGVGATILVKILGESSDLASQSTRAQAQFSRIVAITATSGVSTMFYVGTFLFALLARPRDRLMIRLSLGLVIADGLLNVVIRASHVDVPGAGLFSFFITHVLACAILPWRVTQAVLTAGVVVLVSGLSTMLIEKSISLPNLYSSLAASVVGVPGSLIAWARHSRRLRGYHFEFLQSRYGEVRRELTDARRIHEAMFPMPVTRGPVRLTYRYQPMRQIGGDFLHVESCEETGALSAVLLDVTGHGIPAALTVNRLFGELSRIYAEDPHTPPSVVMSKLNRYVHLTMSQHSVFVTGVCVRVDPQTRTAEYANAGHPPSFVVTADGRLERLDSTGMVLGAIEDDRFTDEPQRIRFEPGDRLIAYTDGATEARNGSGVMYSVSGLQALLSSPAPVAEGSWPSTVIDAINRHRSGNPDDDTLVVELFCPVMSAVSEHGDGPVRRSAETLQRS